MQTSVVSQYGLVWPSVVLAAWLIGETGEKLTKIPRISFYILVGFLAASAQFGLLPSLNIPAPVLVINIAIGLFIFEFGYRINLRWLINNPLIIFTSLVESVLTFTAVYLLCRFFDISTLNALEFASLAMATSPVVIMQIVNDRKSAGQVTEQIIHLTALNSLLAVFFFKMIFGLLVFEKSGNILQSFWASFLILIISLGLGFGFALILELVLKKITPISSERTIVFALFIIFIVAITTSFELSSLLATLVFGIVSRHRLIALGKTQRNFGALGELLTIVLFISVPSILDWHNFVNGIGLAVVLILARLLTKVLPITLFSYFNGGSLYKGFLTGLAMLPTAVFPLIMLDPGRYSGVSLTAELAAFSVAILILEICGPIATKFALIRAKECC